MTQGLRGNPAARNSVKPDSEIAPELLAASRDVDRVLLRWYLDLSVRERLRACTRAGRALGRFKRASSTTG